MTSVAGLTCFLVVRFYKRYVDFADRFLWGFVNGRCWRRVLQLGDIVEGEVFETESVACGKCVGGKSGRCGYAQVLLSSSLVIQSFY